MIQNILTFCVKNDLTFVEGSIPSGKLVANDINRNSIYLVTPYDEAIVKANFQTNLQSDTPTSVLGILVNGKIAIDEIVPTSKSYYNLVKDWNIYEFKVPSTTLSFISRNRTGKIGINFSIEQRLVPTIKDSYGEYQGEILSQGQVFTESGYYINKTIDFELDTGDVNIYDLNDILVLTKQELPLDDIQVKISAYSNRGSTPTTLYSVDPSLLNDNFETIEPSLTTQIVQQVNDNTGDIVLLLQNVGVNNNTLITLENRISVNEQDIDIAEGNITNLQGRMATAELDIDHIEDGTTIVEKALKDSSGNTIKNHYVASVIPTYDDNNNNFYLNPYNGDESLMPTRVEGVTLPKATTLKDGLMAKEDKVKLTDLPTNGQLDSALAVKVPQTRTILGIDLVDDILLGEFKTAIGEATAILSGLMSATDKSRLDALHALLGVETDADVVVNTINEVLAIFSAYPEGADLVNALSSKVDKVAGKGLSANDFTDILKAKLDSLLSGSNYYDKTYIDALKDLNGWSSSLLTETALTNGGVITKATLSDYDVIKLFVIKTATGEIDTDSFDTSIGLVDNYKYVFFDNADIYLSIADPNCTFTDNITGYQLKIIGQKYEAQDADKVNFDKTIKNLLESDDVQGAIDEVVVDLNTLENKVVSAIKSGGKDNLFLAYSSGDFSWIDNYYYYYINGAQQSLSTYSVTNKIDVSKLAGGKVRVYTRMIENTGICFWDENNTFISGTNGSGNIGTAVFMNYDIDIPSNAKYIGISCSKDDKAQVEMYFDYSTKIESKINEQTSVVEKLNNEILTDLDEKTWTDGKYYYYLNGDQTSLSFFSLCSLDVSKYQNRKIRVVANTGDVNAGINFYDENNLFLFGLAGANGLTNYDVVVPRNAKYLGISSLINAKAAVAVYVLDVLDENFAKKYVQLPQTISSGYYINKDNGVLTAFSSSPYNYWASMDYIKVDTKYIYLYTRNSDSADGYAFYNLGKGFISGGDIPATNTGLVELEVPQNAKYFRYTFGRVTGKSTENACPSAVFVKNEDQVFANSDRITELEGTEKSFTNISMFNSIGCCGDSYTAAQFYDANGQLIGDYQNLSWGKILERKCGLNASIFATSGDTTELFITRTLPDLLADGAKDLYIFALGINDVANTTLGTIADINDGDPSQNPNTFYGNYGKILAQVMAHAPNAKILLMKSLLPANSTQYNYSSEAIEEIAEHYGIGYLETYNNPFLASSLYINGMRGGHPTPALQSGMAKCIEELVNDVMTSNFAYFRDYVPING